MTITRQLSGGESPSRSPARVAAAIFVNFTDPAGAAGSIRVEAGTTDAAVAMAKTLGTDIWIRAVDSGGLTLDRVRVRA
jgi:hypothetical protein